MSERERKVNNYFLGNVGCRDKTFPGINWWAFKKRDFITD